MIGPECHPDGIKGYGDHEWGLTFVGIAPGQDEVKHGKPFTGPSGRLLTTVLKNTGWLRSRSYATNLICWYKDDPTKEEQAQCRLRLEEELALAQPKLIVPLGKLAHEALNPEGNTQTISKARGAVLWSPQFNSYVMSTYHPAAVLHGIGKGAKGGVGLRFMPDLFRDLSKVRWILRDWPDDGSAFSQVTHRTVQDAAEGQAFLDGIGDWYATLDIETDSRLVEELDVWNDRLMCFSVTRLYNPITERPEETCVFTFEMGQKMVWPSTVKWVFQNGVYDTNGLLRYYGIDLEIYDDTMLMSYDVDERSGYHGLKPLSREILGAGFYEEEVRKGREKGHMADVPTDKLHKYNAQDSAYTARIHPWLWRKMEKDNVERPYREILIPAANMFKDVVYRGVHINRAAVGKLLMDWTPRWFAGQKELVSLAYQAGWDKDDYNPNSNPQITRLLYDFIKLPETDWGRSSRREALEEIELQFPNIPYIKAHQMWKRLDHAVTNYIIGIDDDLKRDGRIHPTVLLHGQVTGRPSYHRPPLQTIPKITKVGEDIARIRTIFTSADEDHLIMECDYSGSELWVALGYSKDAQLYEDLHGDVHRNVASSIFNTPYADVTKAQRDQSKYVTFGVMYGRGATALGKAELQCHPSVAQQYIDRFYQRYPDYRAWMLQTQQEVRRAKEVVSMTGRKRRFYWLDHPDAHRVLRQSINFPIQSTSNDVTLTSAIAIHRRLKPLDSYVLWTVHDSIVFEISKRHFAEVATIIHEEMTRPRWDLPAMPIEMKVGRSLFDVVEYKTLRDCIDSQRQLEFAAA